MPLDMTQFYQVFYDETAEHLSTMESLLLYLDPQDPDSEQLDDLHRAAHSIKGSGGTFGFSELAGLAQEMESVIESARKGQTRLTEAAVSTLLEACGVLRTLLAGYRSEEPVDTAAAARAADSLRGLATDRAVRKDRGAPSPRRERAVPASARDEEAAVTAPRPVAGELQELARRTAMATNEAMALVEAAGGGPGGIEETGGLREITEAVRELGAAIEQNAALAESVADNAESLRESFRALVQRVAALALASPGRSAVPGRLAGSRPLPKVRRKPGGTAGGGEWPGF